MIDRSYLPFQSAREHQDRGMLKWMGFFLSEHTSSLKEEKLKENTSTELTLLDKLKMISQLYAGQYQGNFTYKEKNRRKNVIWIRRILHGRLVNQELCCHRMCSLRWSYRLMMSS